MKEIYTPFVYPGGKKNTEWWKTHSTGKQLRESRYVDGQWGGQVKHRQFKLTLTDLEVSTLRMLKNSTFGKQGGIDRIYLDEADDTNFSLKG